MNRPTALKAALEQHPAETTVKRMWQEIESQRHAPSPLNRRNIVWAIAATAVAATAIIAVLHLPRTHPNMLLLTDNSTIPDNVYTRTSTRFEFTDGSSINTLPDTRFDTLINRKTAIEFALRSGTMSIQVTPGGERRWTIHCGEVDVIVVGTAFEVTRTDENVTVNVHRGKVCVKGNGVPDGIQMLTASMQLRVPTTHEISLPKSPQPRAGIARAAATSSPPPSQGAGADASGPSKEGTRAVSNNIHPIESPLTPDNAQSPGRSAAMAEAGNVQMMSADAIAPLADEDALSETAKQSHSSEATAPEAARISTWKQLAESGNFNAAYRALPAFTFSTLNARQWSPDDLFLISDIARITRHPNEACAALQELIRRYPGNPRAGIAAYTLARVNSESLQKPDLGASYYEQALELGISKALRETALIRIIEHYRITAPQKAHKYENIYVAEYPSGRYLEYIIEHRQKHQQAAKP